MALYGITTLTPITEVPRLLFDAKVSKSECSIIEAEPIKIRKLEIGCAYITAYTTQLRHIFCRKKIIFL